MRRRPRDLLHLGRGHPGDVGERRQELRDFLALAAEPPELHGPVVAGAAAGEGGQGEDGEAVRPAHDQGALSSQPPVKPARRRPVTTSWLVFRSSQIMPLRWFSTISTIGPWSMPR